jgi:hypothetical protein
MAAVNVNTSFLDQLCQLTKVTWDGDLISKNTRDELVKCGYANKINGYNFITSEGIVVLQNLGCLKK